MQFKISRNLIKEHSFSKDLKNDCKNYEWILGSDTRNFEGCNGFLALRGENFNGENYIGEAIEKGAKFAIVEDTINQEIIENYKNCEFIKVKSPLLLIQELARIHVTNWKRRGGKILAITGSNGKTTTKELVGHLLKGAVEVYVSEANFNNHIGVTYNVLKINSEHKIAVLEIGTNHPGEIAVLCDIILPNYGLITNIGDSHLEFFKTRENVLKEKLDLYHSIVKSNDEQKGFLINGFDPLLSKVTANEFSYLVGSESNSNFFVKKSDADNYRIEFKGNGLVINLKKIFGEHIREDAILAFCMCLILDSRHKDHYIKQLLSFKAPKFRAQWIEHEGKNLFFDAYNANPSSMMASLKSFIQWLQDHNIPRGEALFVLGDMNELGDKAEECHVEVGLFLKKCQIEKVVFVGRYSNYYIKGFQKPASHFSTPQEAQNSFKILLNDSKACFLKASRSINLERLVQNLL